MDLQTLALKMRVRYGISILLLLTSSYKAFSGYDWPNLPVLWNLRPFCETACMPLQSANKAAHSGFETQMRRHKKSKTGVSVATQNGLMSSKNYKNIIPKTYLYFRYGGQRIRGSRQASSVRRGSLRRISTAGNYTPRGTK